MVIVKYMIVKLHLCSSSWVHYNSCSGLVLSISYLFRNSGRAYSLYVVFPVLRIPYYFVACVRKVINT